MFNLDSIILINMGTCLSIVKEFGDSTNKKKLKIIHQRNILETIAFNEITEPIYSFDIAKVIKVYDGDTFTIAAWYDECIYAFSVRLYGIDCPEIRGGTIETKKKALESKQFVIDKILNKVINIDVLSNRKIDGKKIKEKYGRLLARVIVDGEDLAIMMINKGLGVIYNGGKKDVVVNDV
jgi:endonuclease YncB( thermonuclease family)